MCGLPPALCSRRQSARSTFCYADPVGCKPVAADGIELEVFNCTSSGALRWGCCGLALLPLLVLFPSSLQPPLPLLTHLLLLLALLLLFLPCSQLSLMPWAVLARLLSRLPPALGRAAQLAQGHRNKHHDCRCSSQVCHHLRPMGARLALHSQAAAARAALAHAAAVRLEQAADVCPAT